MTSHHKLLLLLVLSELELKALEDLSIDKIISVVRAIDTDSFTLRLNMTVLLC